jgi:hypothetical protein
LKIAGGISFHRRYFPPSGLQKEKEKAAEEIEKAKVVYSRFRKSFEGKKVSQPRKGYFYIIQGMIKVFRIFGCEPIYRAWYIRKIDTRRI